MNGHSPDKGLKTIKIAVLWFPFVQPPDCQTRLAGRGSFNVQFSVPVMVNFPFFWVCKFQT